MASRAESVGKLSWPTSLIWKWAHTSGSAGPSASGEGSGASQASCPASVRMLGVVEERARDSLWRSDSRRSATLCATRVASSHAASRGACSMRAASSRAPREPVTYHAAQGRPIAAATAIAATAVRLAGRFTARPRRTPRP